MKSVWDVFAQVEVVTAHKFQDLKKSWNKAVMTLFPKSKIRTQRLTRLFPLLGIKLSERYSLNAKVLAFLGHR